MKKHSYSIVSMLFWLMFISGCATMGILETPLKHGGQISKDSIKLDCDLQTVSSAISKVEGKQRISECKFYNTKRLSDSSWSIEITEPSKACAMSIDACQERKRKRTFDILLTPTGDNTTIIKVDKGYIIDTAKGAPLPSDTVCEVEICGRLLMFNTGSDVERLNKPIYEPVREEMNEEDLYYNLKDLVLLVEKYLPNTKKN